MVVFVSALTGCRNLSVLESKSREIHSVEGVAKSNHTKHDRHVLQQKSCPQKVSNLSVIHANAYFVLFACHMVNWPSYPAMLGGKGMYPR